MLHVIDPLNYFPMVCRRINIIDWIVCINVWLYYAQRLWFGVHFTSIGLFKLADQEIKHSKPVDLPTKKNTIFKPVEQSNLSTKKHKIQACRPVDQEIQILNLSTCRPRNTTFKPVDLSTKKYNIQTC